MIIYTLDIGGSSVKQSLINPENLSTPITKRLNTVYHKSNKFEDLRHLVLELIGCALAENSSIDIVAISTNGGVNRDGVVMSSSFFEGYADISWEEIIMKSYSTIKGVYTINDGRASTWAEYLTCEEKPEIFVHFVLGTGIGGSSIVNDELISGTFGAAGYLGHIKVSSSNSVLCSCGRVGCVETLAS